MSDETRGCSRTGEPEVGGRREPNVSERSGGDGAAGFLRSLEIGEPLRIGDFEVAPLLLGGQPAEAPVLLTAQAVAAGSLAIVEEDGGGVVQRLLARNSGRLPVAILEGDTLVGCKQNRVVAHSVVVAPGTSVPVPVGCMERGRWSRESLRFAVGNLKVNPSIRACTTREVKAARREGREPRLDQSRLWGQVEDELSLSGVHSDTSNYYAIVERDGEAARRQARELQPRAGQVGILVLRDGVFVGLEAAGHSALWSALSEPTVASYLMGERRGSASVCGERASAREWLARVQSAPVRVAQGLAGWLDLDVDAPELAGAGLALDPRRIVHVAVFPS